MTVAIILIRPQMGENIGAAARAMANFGLKDMRLVAPRDGWPNPKAADMAGKAIPILDDAAVFATAAEAVADCQFVLATTARARAVNMPVLEVRAAMQEVAVRMARGEKCAVLFGAERTGLENEEVALGDAVLTIPVSADYPSLNLAQAVVVVAHEWFSTQANSPMGEVGEHSDPGECIEGRQPSPEIVQGQFRPLPVGEVKEVRFARNEGQRTQPPIPATKHELHGLFGQLEAMLDQVNFWRVAEKKEGLWRSIRASLSRAGLSAPEIAIWRGILRALRS